MAVVPFTINASRGLASRFRGTQNGIAGAMAQCVVDPLEVVEVHHHQRDLLAAPLGERQQYAPWSRKRRRLGKRVSKL